MRLPQVSSEATVYGRGAHPGGGDHGRGILRAASAALVLRGLSAPASYAGRQLPAGVQALLSAICLNDYRPKEKDHCREVWLELKASELHRFRLVKRYMIEHKIAEAKGQHGMRRCRCPALLREGLQAILVASVLNLRRTVGPLSGRHHNRLSTRPPEGAGEASQKGERRSRRGG